GGQCTDRCERLGSSLQSPRGPVLRFTGRGCRRSATGGPPGAVTEVPLPIRTGGCCWGQRDSRTCDRARYRSGTVGPLARRTGYGCAPRVVVGELALVALLGLPGLRIVEACGASIGDLAEEHGHRVLQVLGKGG